MQKIIPQKLQPGDTVMVIAPSRGLNIIGGDCREIAAERFEAMGLKVKFADNLLKGNYNKLGTLSAADSAADVMQAFADKSVKAVFTLIGGFNSNRILSLLDYDLIRRNPKILCGFSDVTALLDAVNAKTGLEVYYGPHYSSFGMKKGCEYTAEYMKKMLFADEKIEIKSSAEWSDDLWFADQENRVFIKNDGYWNIRGGHASGAAAGGNLGTFCLLAGTEYSPRFEKDTILMIEDTSDCTATVFDRTLQSVCSRPDFKNVRGLVIGRFQKGSEMSRETLEYIIKSKPELDGMPVLANVDYGHTTPVITIPLGGTAEIADGRLFLEK